MFFDKIIEDFLKIRRTYFLQIVVYTCCGFVNLNYAVEGYRWFPINLLGPTSGVIGLESPRAFSIGSFGHNPHSRE